jgi:hypothetical protein
MPATYEPIATYTVSGSPVASYTFSSIPQTYTDLILYSSVQGQANGCAPTLVLNNVTSGTLYSVSILYTDGLTTWSGARGTNLNNFDIGTTSGLPYANTNQYAPVIAHFMDYTNTSINKTIFYSYYNATGGYVGGADISHAAGLFRSTSAITSITVSVNNGKTIPVGCTYTLYGIKAA